MLAALTLAARFLSGNGLSRCHATNLAMDRKAVVSKKPPAIWNRGLQRLGAVPLVWADECYQTEFSTSSFLYTCRRR
jgi:hypothetical protein